MAGFKNEGTRATMPAYDDYIILKVSQLEDGAKLHLSIGETLKSKNVDKCSLTKGK